MRKWQTVLVVLLLVMLSGVIGAQEDEAPSQIDFALAALSQGIREDVTLDDLTNFQWIRREFADASLGCPRSGQSYAQVITPGYQFLLTYDGTLYDYRVSDDGEQVVLCDTRPAIPEATPDEPPVSTCDDTYLVQEDDTLSEIAQQCGTTIAALLAANPSIPDPSLIFSGQTLTIPEDTAPRTVTIRPLSGPPGTPIQVYASGFPPGAQVELGLGPPASEYEVVATREIGIDGELVATLRISTQIAPPEERVAVVVLNNEETVSEAFEVTEGEPVTPEPTPTQPTDEGALFEQTQIYLVAVGDEGRSGQAIGCGDSLIPVTVTFEPTVAPLTAALEELFAIDSRTYGQSGLYNALYRSDLSVAGIDIQDGLAVINLSGELRIGGVCDEPRVIQQIEQTALQYATIDSVAVFIDGVPLEEAF